MTAILREEGGVLEVVLPVRRQMTYLRKDLPG